MIGTEVGRYRLESKLGQGGMGAVYLGVNDTIGSRVAVKILSDACSDDPEMIERFFAEARAVNLIRHENIVDVLDLGRLPDGRPYMVMELVDGQTLGHIVRRSRPPLGGIASVTLEVLSALEAAHAIGIVHRDLKPDNVLVTPKGHAKVLDFGIAKLARTSPEHVRTMTGALLGTPAYMSPEQCANAATVDGRSDIYAAGILLFESITSRLPFTGSAYELMRAHADDPPPPARAFRPDLPPAFEQVIGTALEKDPARRFQTAGHMAAAIREASGALPPHEWQMIAPVARAAASSAAPTPAGPPFVGTPPAMSVATPSSAGTPRAGTPPAMSVVAPSVIAPSAVGMHGGATIGTHGVSARGGVTVGTHGGAAVGTLPPHGVATIAHSDAVPRRNRLPFAIGGGVVVIASVVVVGIVVSRSSPEPSGSSNAGSPDPNAGSPSSPDTSNANRDPDNPKRMPAGWDDNPDPQNLQLGSAIRLGFAMAQLDTPDARLVELQLHPIAKTGKVDLSRAKSGAPATKLVFESESLRAAGKKCRLVVTLAVDTEGVMEQTRVFEAGDCKRTAVPMPRCGLKFLAGASQIGKSGVAESPATARYTMATEPTWTFEWKVLQGEETALDWSYPDSLCRG